MHCPVCKADNELVAVCRRCKADLALLLQVETERERFMAAARQALAQCDAAGVLRHATRSHQLRAAEDSARLLSLGHLLGCNFGLALRWAASLQ